MAEPTDLAHAIDFRAFFFEEASEHHLVEHRSEDFLVGLLYGFKLGSSAFLVFGFRKLDDLIIDTAVLRFGLRRGLFCDLAIARGLRNWFLACCCLWQNYILQTLRGKHEI